MPPPEGCRLRCRSPSAIGWSHNYAVVLEVLCFLSSANLADNDQLIHFKISELLSLLGLLQNRLKFPINFVYFFWKIVRSSDFYERPHELFVLVKAELRNYRSRFGRWLACDYSMNALKLDTLYVFFFILSQSISRSSDSVLTLKATSSSLIS